MGLIILFKKKVLAGESKTKYCISLIISLMVIILSVGLRITYESKIDATVSDFSNTGRLQLNLNMDTDYYSYVSAGTIRNPSTNIKIGDLWYDSGDTILVDLNKSYPIRIGCGYSGSGGYIDESIVFSKDLFRNAKCSMNRRVNIGSSEYAIVEILFSRVCSFWEVIFY